MPSNPFGHQNSTKRSHCKFEKSFDRKRGQKLRDFFSCSLVGNEEGLSVYELHIAVKDKCFGFGREDRLVGVAVMQLKDIENQVRCLFF